MNPYLEGLEEITGLFNVEKKKAAEKYCRGLTITSRGLMHISLAGRGGALRPYQYACRFSDVVPSHLPPHARDREALSSNGAGPLSPSAKRAVRKIGQIFRDRRIFAAHLFYTSNFKFWHLFYFDQRDFGANDNHWQVGGPHIHYSRDSITHVSLDAVWTAICATPPNPPPAVHIRYQDLGTECG